jgi:hypothetical protein
LNFTPPKTTIKFTPEQPIGFASNTASTGKSQQKSTKATRHFEREVLLRGKASLLLNFETNGAVCKQSGQNAFILSEKHKIIMKYEL